MRTAATALVAVAAAQEVSPMRSFKCRELEFLLCCNFHAVSHVEEGTWPKSGYQFLMAVEHCSPKMYLH